VSGHTPAQQGGPAPGIGDARFFRRTGPHSLASIAAAAGLPEPADPRRMVAAVAPLQAAGPNELSFLDNRRYADALAASQAGVVVVHPEMAPRVPAAAVALLTPEPYLAWARICALFHPLPPATPGIHPAAAIAAGATVDPSAEIGPFAVIESGAEIGPRCRIAPHAVIGQGVRLGADCRIGAHAVVSHSLIGDRVVLFPGVKIGQEGFGFATTAAGHVSVPQLGRVLIGNDVEIGANTTIDRGSAQDTVIGDGCRIDNLVQIGHNVRLGRACVIVSMVGISGSAVLEDFVVVAGQAGIAGHLHIGRGARIGGQAGVMADVPAGADVVGAPAVPVREFFRQVAFLKKLARSPAQKKPTD
jgi:UDP-3-O-[3-hydroxymyristoyl] glucosamine N-acyltransferase